MTYHAYSFEKLEVWKIARSVKKDIYKDTRSFPKDEMFGLTSQIRRAAGSITANLAEGSGRATQADKAHFVNIAYASGLEVLDHLITSYDLEYISRNAYENYRVQMDELLNKLNSYYKYQLNRENDLKDKFRK